MEILIPIGSVLTLLGVLGLGYCIWLAVSARRKSTSEDELKKRLQSVVALNMAALGLSALGLMMVVIGVLL